MEKEERKVKWKALTRTLTRIFDWKTTLKTICIIFGIIFFVIGIIDFKPIEPSEEQIISYTNIVERTYPNDTVIKIDNGDAAICITSNQDSKTVDCHMEDYKNFARTSTLVFQITEEGSAEIVKEKHSAANLMCLIVTSCITAGGIGLGICIFGIGWVIKFITDKIVKSLKNFAKEPRKKIEEIWSNTPMAETKRIYDEELEKVKKEEFK